MKIIIWIIFSMMICMSVVCEAEPVSITVKACGPCGCPNEGGPASSIYYGTWTNSSSGNVLKMLAGNVQNSYIGDYRTPKGELTFSFCMNNNSRGPGLTGTAITSDGSIKQPLYLNINPNKPNEMFYELTSGGNAKTPGYFYRN